MSMPPPPPPRALRGGGPASLRKQALMGASRSTTGHVATVLEEPQPGGGADQGIPRAAATEQASSSGRTVALRPWQDYWDACRMVQVPGR